MKKILIIISLLFLITDTMYAMNPTDSLIKIPWNFSPECYEYYNKIDEILEKFVKEWWKVKLIEKKD